MKPIKLLLILSLVLLVGCEPTPFERCIEEGKIDCFEDGNCAIGTTLDDIKVSCCFEENGIPTTSKIDGTYLGCIQATA